MRSLADSFGVDHEQRVFVCVRQVFLVCPYALSSGARHTVATGSSKGQSYLYSLSRAANKLKDLFNFRWQSSVAGVSCVYPGGSSIWPSSNTACTTRGMNVDGSLSRSIHNSDMQATVQTFFKQINRFVLAVPVHSGYWCKIPGTKSLKTSASKLAIKLI